MLSASDDHTLRLWQSDTATCLAVFPADEALERCAFSPDGQRIVAVGHSGALYVLELHT